MVTHASYSHQRTSLTIMRSQNDLRTGQIGWASLSEFISIVFDR